MVHGGLGADVNALMRSDYKTRFGLCKILNIISDPRFWNPLKPLGEL